MACAELLSQLLQNPEGEGKMALVIGRTATHCKEQLLPIFKSILTNRTARGVDVGYRPGDYRVTLSPQIKIELPRGSSILMWSIEGATNIPGFNMTHVLIDEVTHCPEAIFDEAFARIGRQGVRGRIWCVGNPSNYTSWVWRRYFKPFEDAGEVNVPGCGTSCHYLSTYDNPYTEQKRGDYETQYVPGSLAYRRAIQGRFCNLDGLVFSNFDREKHCFDKMQVKLTDCAHYMGVDFGEKDPTAILNIAYDPGTSAFYVFREYRKSGGTIPEHAAYIKRQQARYAVQRIISDTHRETVTSYKLEGVGVEPFEKSPGSVVAGVGYINQLLVDGRLFISKECHDLIMEMETYEWKTTTTGKEEPKPVHGDHAIDALRYVVMSVQRSAGLQFGFQDDPVEEPPAPKGAKIFGYIDGEPQYIYE